MGVYLKTRYLLLKLDWLSLVASIMEVNVSPVAVINFLDSFNAFILHSVGIHKDF